ncbi:MAG: hypothetical protein AAF958_16745 [Planctomycetota bacterium]
MRNLLVIAALGVAAFMAGWFQIHREGDETTIRINRKEIRSDARAAIDRGKEILDRRDQESSRLYAEDGNSPRSYSDNRYGDANGTADGYRGDYQPVSRDDDRRYDNRYRDPRDGATGSSDRFGDRRYGDSDRRY